MSGKAQKASGRGDSGTGTDLYDGTGATLYDRMADDPDRSARDARYVAEYARKVGPPLRVLDVGCGTGTQDFYLAEQGLEVVGVDISEDMLAIARQRVPNVTFIRGDAAQLLDLALEAPFQIVFASGGVLHYLEEEAELAGFFAGAKELLAPGGTVIVESLDLEQLPQDGPAFERDGLIVQQCWREGIGKGGSAVTALAVYDSMTGEAVMHTQPVFNANPGDLIGAASGEGLELADRHSFSRHDSDRSARPTMLVLAFQRATR